MTDYKALVIVLFANVWITTEAAITCYECLDCPQTITINGPRGSKKSPCKYCKTIDKYDNNGFYETSQLFCVTENVACVNILNGTNTGVEVTYCCHWNECNTGLRLGATFVIGSLVILVTACAQIS